MAHLRKRDARMQTADRRHRTTIPSPPVEEIQRRLLEVLTPATFAQARRATSHLNLRDRVLNLPTMTAITLSLVWRQIPSLSEVIRLLEQEDLLWAESLDVSLQALSKRFASMPAEAFAVLLQEVVAAMPDRTTIHTTAEREAVTKPLARIAERFAKLWIADASTLEHLRKSTSELRQHDGAALGGKMLAIVDALWHRPQAVFYHRHAGANEKLFKEQLLQVLPERGLLVLDRGFFSFALFDAFTDQGKYFLTRAISNMRYRTQSLLSQGTHYRDEIIELGLHRSDPCEHPVRMVSVLWNGTWYRYVTNALEPEQLSAEDVTLLYRTRWRIEEAFLLTKRLLGLSYLWVGSKNGVELQLYATWIFYTVLIDLCAEVSLALQQPLDRISVEMVFRSLYHYSRAILRAPDTPLIEYLVERAKSFALLKTERNRHRKRQQMLNEIWDSA